MHIYTEAKAIVNEAIDQVGIDRDDLEEFIHESIDGHEVCIYHGKAITFCATQDTNRGEEWLEDCGGITQEGDSFGSIACRIAFATLYVACEAVLEETLNEMEDA
jgi:hypothetical protein